MSIGRYISKVYIIDYVFSFILFHFKSNSVLYWLLSKLLKLTSLWVTPIRISQQFHVHFYIRNLIIHFSPPKITKLLLHTNFAENLLLFSPFLLLAIKNVKNKDLNQRLKCAAPNRWSKYTTNVKIKQPLWIKFLISSRSDHHLIGCVHCSPINI